MTTGGKEGEVGGEQRPNAKEGNKDCHARVRHVRAIKSRASSERPTFQRHTGASRGGKEGSGRKDKKETLLAR